MVCIGAYNSSRAIQKRIVVNSTGVVLFVRNIARSIAVASLGIVTVVATFINNSGHTTFQIAVSISSVTITTLQKTIAKPISIVSTSLVQWLARIVKKAGPESLPRNSGWPAAPRE
jgi:hypothetical protein